MIVNFNQMEDIDILRGLYSQRKSLAESLLEVERRVDGIKADISKVNRLIDLLEEVELKRLKEENKNVLDIYRKRVNLDYGTERD